jgi:DNA-binding NarL/FixJ family response regulator
MPIKVLLADDTELIRRAIRRVLENHPEIQLVGEASDFAQAIEMKKQLRPDVVVTDLYMPNGSKIPTETIRELLNHESCIVAISVWVDDDAKNLAKSLGAFRLLDKMDVGNSLVATIKECVTQSASGAAN